MKLKLFANSCGPLSHPCPHSPTFAEFHLCITVHIYTYIDIRVENYDVGAEQAAQWNLRAESRERLPLSLKMTTRQIEKKEKLEKNEIKKQTASDFRFGSSRLGVTLGK